MKLSVDDDKERDKKIENDDDEVLRGQKECKNKFLKSARLMSIIWQISIIDAAIKTNGI